MMPSERERQIRFLQILRERPDSYTGYQTETGEVDILWNSFWFSSARTKSRLVQESSISYLNFLDAIKDSVCDILDLDYLVQVDEIDYQEESKRFYALYIALLMEAWGISEDELTAQQLPDAINTA